MKKVFVSMMLAVALLTGGSAFAQTKSDGNTGATAQKPNTECTSGSACCTTDAANKGKKDKKGKKGNKDFKGKKGKQFNPFDGVQLSADQQQRLQVLQQGLGPVVLSKEQQAKIPVNPDLTPEQKQQLKAERKAKKLEAKKQYLNGVKEILTPDQYVVFLENVYLYAPQNQGKADLKAAKSKARHGEKGKKENKGDKAKAK